MRLEQLQQFVKVAQKGNFRKASRELGISQPALSRSIRNLEDHFGVPLFDRLPGGINLTRYGEIVLEWAQEILASSSNVKRHISFLEDVSTSRLIIAVGPYFADSFLAEAIAEVINRHPAMNIKVFGDTWKNAEGLLLNREVDLFLGWIDQPLSKENLSVIDIIQDSMVIFCRDNHPILEVSNPGMDDIMKFPFAGPVIPEPIQKAIDRMVPGTMGPTRPFLAVEFDKYSEVRKIVELTDCIGGLPGHCMRPFLGKGTLRQVPFSIPGAGGTLGASFLKGGTMLPGTKLIIEELTRVVKERLKAARSLSES